MTQTLILYLISSIILTLILNFLDKSIKENFYHFIIITQIYLLILSGICTTYHLTSNNNSIFLVTLFAFFIKIFYLYYTEDSSQVTDTKNLKKEIYNVIASYLLNIFFINKVENVFLTLDEFKILIWISVIIYLYTNIQKLSSLKIQRDYFLKKRDGEYIVIEYAKLKNRFQNIIHTNTKELIPLIYAIMIYENYKKPVLFRKIDLLLYKLDNERRSFGIMQISSNYPINDEKSIILATKKLERIYKQIPNKKNKISEVLKKYLKKNTSSDEVILIYQKILSFKD